MSTCHSSSSSGITPALCARSHSTSTPRSWAFCVIRCMSCRLPSRKLTWESISTATLSSRQRSSSSTATLLIEQRSGPSRDASPSAMYRSVGKLSCCDRIRFRSGRSISAVLSSLNRFTEMLSAHTTCPGAAPTSRPRRSPTRVGIPIQSLLFQLAISSSPHSCSITRVTRSETPRGRAPRELPSR